MFDTLFDSKRSRVLLALAAAVALAGGVSAANAEMMKLKANMNAASEVPPTTSKGSGTAEFTYDTASKKLDWTVSYKDMSGPVTAGHIHGPAAPGANAGVAVPFQNAGSSPIKGSATLTDAQAADLMAGKDYVNLHTAANKGGEIRGQIMK
jgi:Cu/Zn superoxide dismutase